MATAAEHAQLARQSMKTPPLFEPPPTSTQYLEAPAPSRQSMLFTQPVANPDYRNSSIIYEKKPKSNRNSALLTNAELQEKKKVNRATVFLDSPATWNPGRNAGAEGPRRSSSGTQAHTRGSKNSRPMSLDAAGMRQKTRNRHTVMNPTGIGLTITPQTPVPEEDEDLEVSSNSTLKDSPPMDPSTMSGPGAPGSRPVIKSQISDLYGLHEDDDDEMLAPTAAQLRPPLTTSESTLVSQPLVKNTQLRPNAREIRSRRHSRASRTLSKAASTPLSNSYGVGIASMTCGGSTNAGLKDMSFGQYGMNQNFGIVSHRASQYLAQEATEEDERQRDKVRCREERAQRQRAARNRGGARIDSPVKRKPVAKTPVAARTSKSRSLKDILFGWAKGFKSGGQSREVLKERIQHTTI